MDIKQILIEEFSLKEFQVQNVMKLIEEGNTIPFIARYRKEMTGSMSDSVLRDFDERLKYLKSLDERKQAVTALIDEQGKLTEDIITSLEKAKTLQEVEDIYAPYKQKKKTRASVAIQKGLQPLADLLLSGDVDILSCAGDYLDTEKDVNSAQDAIKGAMDIVAEVISEDFELKKVIRKIFFDTSFIVTSLKKGAEDDENSKTYNMYHDFTEKAINIPSYRVLAINRGEKDDILKVSIDSDFEKFVDITQKKYIKSDKNKKILEDVIEDSLKRLMIPSLERELRSHLTEKSEDVAIEVFGKNLSSLLMQAPLPKNVVMGWDPAYRTGCKIAIVDETGKVLDTATVYPTAPQNKIKETTEEITKLIKKYKVSIIAIGNGTASRESEQIVADIIKDMKGVHYTIVNEAGASVYSASELGEKELPDMNVSLRGAVSIARRLQDPMSELVKIDPKSIGVGQYQHDINQKSLAEKLGNVVEDNVNKVGVDINTASYSILTYVSGINSSVAKNIISYRDKNGPFTSRNQLHDVPRLGEVTFNQCAGFLRFKNSDNILDYTSVHPESYEQTDKLLDIMDIDKNDKDNFSDNFSDKIKSYSVKDLSEKLNIGVPTLQDIIVELQKPGLDVRDETGLVPILRSDVLKLEDLSQGMILKGTVRNVVQFGAFVDIGVKNDGLVHISEMSHKFIKNPSDLVSVGDIVEVKVLDIDMDRGKVSLTMKK